MRWKIRVRSTLCLIKHHGTKGYGERKPRLHEVDEGELPASRPGRLILQKPWYPLNGSLGKYHSHSAHFRRQNKPSAPQRIDLRLPGSTRVTIYLAIPVSHKMWLTIKPFCFLDRAYSIMKTKINQQNSQINVMWCDNCVMLKHSTVITSRREHIYITTF